MSCSLGDKGGSMTKSLLITANTMSCSLGDEGGATTKHYEL
jgi:hypothetical protein